MRVGLVLRVGLGLLLGGKAVARSECDALALRTSAVLFSVQNAQRACVLVQCVLMIWFSQGWPGRQEGRRHPAVELDTLQSAVTR